MLVTRGMSLKLFGGFDRLEGTHIDLRAAVAAFHTKTEQWDGWPSLLEATQQLLCVKALLKKDCTCPHYSRDEIDKIQKELRLRHYSPDCYKCLG